MSKGHEALPFLKERGHQEAIAMAVKFQNPKKSEQTKEVVVQENAISSMTTMTLAMNNTETGSNPIKERQQKRQKVLEHFYERPKEEGS